MPVHPHVSIHQQFTRFLVGTPKEELDYNVRLRWEVPGRPQGAIYKDYSRPDSAARWTSELQRDIN